ncbi:MAG TPA: carboxypeptidase regulatory-like domain-containing protein [Candidatus Limnocylindrales bacterium]|nr:carboxypeptidase regulatory-like domain-containing protein [Candidatus Limnocylindrales bacterium]
MSKRIVILLLTCTAALAQFNAALQGTVSDPSGAVIPGATVTLTNNETNAKQTMTSSGEGFYRFTGLAPGTYTLSAEAQKFNRQEVKNIAVQAEQTQAANVTLTPGQITQTVTVTAENNVALQTENAQVGTQINAQEVTSLPQFGRDPYELVRLSPNVTADMARSGSGQAVGLPNTTGPGGSNSGIFQTENQLPVSANGQRMSNNDYEIDGVSVNSLGWGGSAVITPNQESIKQMVVLTNAYSAEWGRNSGAQINVISQNGTDQLHGSGVFHLDSPGLNAYNKWGGPAGAAPVRDNNLLRQYAASIGGPIIKDKLFWFFSYEGLREHSSNVYTTWVETPQFRQALVAARPNTITAQIFGSPGIAPRVINVLNSPCPTAFAAGTCQQVTGGIDVGSFTGATGQYTPGITGGGLDGVADLEFAQLASPSTTEGNQYNGRVDFNATAKDSAFVSMYFTKLYNLGADTSTGSRPMADVNFGPLNTAVTAQYNRIVSPTMLNELRANLTRFAANQVTSNAGVVNYGIPRVEVQGYPISRLEFGAAQGESSPGIFAQNTYEVRDQFNWVHGNHGLKLGVEMRREQDNNNLVGGARPDFVFNGLWDLANGAAIFEGIDANPVTGGPANSQRYLRTPYYGWFVQDDWKVRPNLTVNLGVRWEYFSPVSDAHGQLSNIVFGSQGLANATVQQVDRMYRPDRNNFAPRLGFAYTPGRMNQKLVVRGGFGIFYDRIPEVLFTNAAANPPFFARYGICCGTAANPFVGGQIQYELGTSNSPFSYPANPALAQGINAATGTPNAGAVEIWGAQQYMPNPMIYVYSMDVEYTLPARVVLDLGYSGSTGRHLIRLVNENYLYPNNMNLKGGAAFTAVYIPQPDSNQNYNAGLVSLRRSMNRGFQLIANYKWSKSLDNSSYEGPGFVTNQTYPQNNRLEWGPSDYDVRHLVTASVVWDIPTGHMGGVMKSIFGGWQLAPIETWHTGYPWTPVIGQSVQTPGGPSLSPIRPTQYFGGAGSSQSIDAFMTGSNFPKGGKAYFNTTASGPPGIGRNSFRGPRFWQTDLSFAKFIRMPFFFGEGSNLELRGNFFNIFNQLNLQPLNFSAQGTHPELNFFGTSPGALAGRVVELQARFSF